MSWDAVLTIGLALAMLALWIWVLPRLGFRS